MSRPKHTPAPMVGRRVRCLRAPSFAIPETARAMVGQIGIIEARYPADPRDPDDEEFIGIQYPLTPYSDNRIALPVREEGESWELI